MLSGKQLAAALKPTGTGQDKLKLCESVSQADSAIELLKQGNHHVTARKAQAILDEHLAEQAKKKAEKDEKAKAEQEAAEKAKQQSQQNPQGAGQQK